jgi:hypothetical protein
MRNTFDIWICSFGWIWFIIRIYNDLWKDGVNNHGLLEPSAKVLIGRGLFETCKKYIFGIIICHAFQYTISFFPSESWLPPETQGLVEDGSIHLWVTSISGCDIKGSMGHNPQKWTQFGGFIGAPVWRTKISRVLSRFFFRSLWSYELLAIDQMFRGVVTQVLLSFGDMLWYIVIYCDILWHIVIYCDILWHIAHNCTRILCFFGRWNMFFKPCVS